MKFLNWLFRRRGRAEIPKFDRERLQRRLAAMPADDPLWPELLALLDAFVLTEARASASGGLDDAEAHRFRGRLGMLMDLRDDLQKVWHAAHEPPKS